MRAVALRVKVPPTLTSISPASGVQGSTVPVTLTGTDFVAGATVAVSNPGVAVSNVVVVSGTQITATFTIGAGAALGAANVTVLRREIFRPNACNIQLQKSVTPHETEMRDSRDLLGREPRT